MVASTGDLTTSTLSARPAPSMISLESGDDVETAPSSFSGFRKHEDLGGATLFKKQPSERMMR